MGSFSVGDMCDKIDNYFRITKKFEFVKHPENNGTGDKSWSLRYNNQIGESIEIRNSEWTFYDIDRKEITTGSDPESLHRYLLSNMNKEELIEFIISNKGD